MLSQKIIFSALAGSFMYFGGAIYAADQVQDKTKDQTRLRDKDQIYGSQLMTDQERIEHRTQMRNLKTLKERQAYQLEHHKKMQERAKEKGITIPDEPMRGPGGMGPGGGSMGPDGRR